MKDSLHAAQRVQVVLLLASAAILILALSPRLSGRYESALREIAALQRIPFEDVKAELAEWASAHEAEFEASQRNLPVAHAVMSAISLGTATWPNLRWHTDTVTARHWLFEQLGSRATIEQVARYLEEDPALRIVEVSDSGVVTSVPIPQAFECEDSTSIGSDGNTYPMWACASRGQISAEKLQSPPHFRIYISQPPFYNLPVLLAEVPGRIRVMPGTSVTDWLARRGELDLIAPIVDGQRVFLPAVLGIWSDVRDLTLPQAEAVVLDRMASSRQTVAFFGLSVDEVLARIGGPLLLLLLLVYFRLHLTHISHSSANSENSLHQIYPWPYLFAGRTAYVLRLATIAAPLAACMALIARGGAAATVSDATAIALVCLVGLECLWIHQTSRRLLAGDKLGYDYAPSTLGERGRASSAPNKRFQETGGRPSEQSAGCGEASGS
jgi:hypothetical protein